MKEKKASLFDAEKKVYLFELDSVRKSDDEIIEGQEALFNEIVTHGNQVVLTYNQFVDSRGFFSLLNNEKYYNSIIKLFEDGAIKISQYKDIRTLAQYIIYNIENDEKEFIYSALPLKGSQKRLAALVRRSLMYSDLSEIKIYIDKDYENNKKAKKELNDLFVEVKDGIIVQEETNDINSFEEKVNILKKLYSLLAIVLRLSPMENIYLSPRKKDEYEKSGLKKFLGIVLSNHFADNYVNDFQVENFNVEDFKTLWENAVALLKPIYQEKENDKDEDFYPRSVFIRRIKNASLNKLKQELNCYKLAEAIVNLCYNYTCEASICDISKHYDFTEIENENSDYKTFKEDFFNRLKQHLGKDNFLQDETNEFITFEGKIPDFNQAVRTYELINNQKKKRSKKIYDISADSVPAYEYKLKEQNKAYKKYVLRQLFKRLLTFVVFILIAIIIEGLLGLIGNNDEYNWTLIFNTIWISMVGLFAGEIITYLLSKVVPGFLQLSDALQGLILWGKDLFMYSKKHNVYSNESVEEERVEKCATMTPIDYYESKNIRRYRKWIEKNKELISESSEYPIADLSENNIRKMMREEELYNYRFGIPYESKYSVMVVDPIVDDKIDAYDEKNKIFPYERLTPTTPEAGVVAVVRHEGEMILLKQYRHALRKEQYSFPRGFANKGQSLYECVIQELQEEINAVIKGEPVLLGKIAPDSGITSKVVSIFLVDVESYFINQGHEGIKDCEKVTIEKLEKMIENDQINDGYTLGAYALFKQKVNG